MSDLTDWISAAGQAVGAVATAGALWVGAVTLRHQVDDKRKCQANLVAIRVHEEPHITFGRANFRVLVENKSQLPIYDVRVHSGNTLVGYHENVDQAVILPGATANLVGPYTENDDFSSAVIFRDNSGLWWGRWDYGFLYRVRNPYNYGVFQRVFIWAFKYEKKRSF
jgi:hypothetical protein